MEDYVYVRDNQSGVLVRFKARLAFLPVTVQTEPLAFAVTATETANGLRISKVCQPVSMR